MAPESEALAAAKSLAVPFDLTYRCYWCDLEATIFVEYEWKGGRHESGVMAFCGHHARVMGACAGATLCIGPKQ